VPRHNLTKCGDISLRGIRKSTKFRHFPGTFCTICLIAGLYAASAARDTAPQPLKEHFLRKPRLDIGEQVFIRRPIPRTSLKFLLTCLMFNLTIWIDRVKSPCLTRLFLPREGHSCPSSRQREYISLTKVV